MLRTLRDFLLIWAIIAGGWALAQAPNIGGMVPNTAPVGAGNIISACGLANGQLLYNNAGSCAGTGTITYDGFGLNLPINTTGLVSGVGQGGGVSINYYTNAGVQSGSTALFKWGNGGPASTMDTGLTRNAAGVLEVDSGTAGTYRDLLARTTITNPTTVASLPTCAAGNEGARAYVTDQNTAVSYRGAVTGGGSTRQAVLCSNSAWLQD
jgi:hypothetical protein